MSGEKRKPIRSFVDLDVYQNAYKAMLLVINEVIPLLPSEERYDLADQLRRSVKAIPRLIAEGYSKKHQRRGFQKYLDDAMAEGNEMIVSLSQVRDLYGKRYRDGLLNSLIDLYDKISKQTYKLMIVWQDFKLNELRNSRAAPREPITDTRIAERETKNGGDL